MTTDGISDSDWERVHELTVESANHAIAEDFPMVEIMNSKLLDVLDELEETYGELPSILATRADYTDDHNRKKKLFERAYSLALKLDDDSELSLISHSLAELMIEEFQDRALGAKWLAAHESHLGENADEFDLRQIDELKSHLTKL